MVSDVSTSESIAFSLIFRIQLIPYHACICNKSNDLVIVRLTGPIAHAFSQVVILAHANPKNWILAQSQHDTDLKWIIILINISKEKINIFLRPSGPMAQFSLFLLGRFSSFNYPDFPY